MFVVGAALTGSAMLKALGDQASKEEEIDLATNLTEHGKYALT